MYIQVYTTVSSKEEAERIAGALLEAKLAVCCQISGPVENMYRQLVVKQEWLCLVKTISNKYAEIEKMIKSMHSYPNPEILTFYAWRGSSEYQKWVDQQF